MMQCILNCLQCIDSCGAFLFIYLFIYLFVYTAGTTGLA